MPNAQLAQSIVTNFDLPEKELTVLIQVGVSYDSNLEKVKKATIDEAMAVLRGRQFVDQYLIKHEFIKRLHRRYQQEGIQIPFPIRTIHLEKVECRQK